MKPGAWRVLIGIAIVLVVICLAIALGQWRAEENVRACRAHLPACPYGR